MQKHLIVYFLIFQDLVAWVTLGSQHLPQTENLPNTLTAGGALSLFLSPFNYFDEDPSMRSKDSVRITPKDPEKPTEGANVERHHKYTHHCSPIPKYPDVHMSKNSTTVFT